MIGYLLLNKSIQVISYDNKGDLGMEKSYTKQRSCDFLCNPYNQKEYPFM